MHEIKHDGFRLQIHARKDRVRLYTMTGVMGRLWTRMAEQEELNDKMSWVDSAARSGWQLNKPARR